MHNVLDCWNQHIGLNFTFSVIRICLSLNANVFVWLWNGLYVSTVHPSFCDALFFCAMQYLSQPAVQDLPDLNIHGSAKPREIVIVEYSNAEVTLRMNLFCNVFM